VSLAGPAPDEDLRRRAERRVNARRGLVIHAALYLVVNLGLVAINLATTPGRLWFFWPAFGWG
jgi:hypothetical protein